MNQWPSDEVLREREQARATLALTADQKASLQRLADGGGPSLTSYQQTDLREALARLSLLERVNERAAELVNALANVGMYSDRHDDVDRLMRAENPLRAVLVLPQVSHRVGSGSHPSASEQIHVQRFATLEGGTEARELVALDDFITQVVRRGLPL